ncbi:MAG: type II toxin-antitoxin system VapC family toxin [Candidatus Rokubacteria bacterium]|nr:type II toxin-antitoxin system VapC family toxin [Candidatus Rokubacteria bacterium]
MILLDSSFLVAYHNRRDVHHGAAAAAMESLLAGEWGPALLLEYVFLEVVTVLLARRGLDVAVRVATVLLQARDVEFVPSSDMFLDVMETFRAQRHGRLSFTDAAIVTVARNRDVRFVATFDRDFQRVGDLAVVPA